MFLYFWAEPIFHFIAHIFTCTFADSLSCIDTEFKRADPTCSINSHLDSKTTNFSTFSSPKPVSNSNSKSKPETFPYSDIYTNSNSDSHTNSRTNSNTNSHPNSYPDSNSCTFPISISDFDP